MLRGLRLMTTLLRLPGFDTYLPNGSPGRAHSTHNCTGRAIRVPVVVMSMARIPLGESCWSLLTGSLKNIDMIKASRVRLGLLFVCGVSFSSWQALWWKEDNISARICQCV